MSDVHLQDLYGRFSDNDYKSILNPKIYFAENNGFSVAINRFFNGDYTENGLLARFRTVLGTAKPVTEPYRRFFPIPQTVIGAKDLDQNEGYK